MKERRQQRLREQPVCSAMNCTNTRAKNKDLSFFPFPTDGELCRKWLISVGRFELTEKTVDQLHKENFLCSVHFDDSQFSASGGRRELRHAVAIPAIFDVPPRPRPPETTNTDTSIFQRNIRDGFCGAVGCINAYSKRACLGKYFFLFPKEELRCKEWVERCGRKDLLGLSAREIQEKGVLLCSEHFLDNQFTNPSERKRLIRTAFPSLFDNTASRLDEGRGSPLPLPPSLSSPSPSRPRWVPSLNLTTSGAMEQIEEAKNRLAWRGSKKKKPEDEENKDDDDDDWPFPPDPATKADNSNLGNMWARIHTDVRECDNKACVKERKLLNRELCHTLVLLKVLREKILDIQRLAETTELDLLQVLVSDDARGRRELDKLCLVIRCVMDELELNRIDEEMKMAQEPGDDDGDSDDMSVDGRADENEASVIEDDNDDYEDNDDDDYDEQRDEEAAVSSGNTRTHHSQQQWPRVQNLPKSKHTQSAAIGRNSLSSNLKQNNNTNNKQVRVVFQTDTGIVLSAEACAALLKNRNSHHHHQDQNPLSLSLPVKSERLAPAPPYSKADGDEEDPDVTYMTTTELKCPSESTTTTTTTTVAEKGNAESPQTAVSDTKQTGGITFSQSLLYGEPRPKRNNKQLPKSPGDKNYIMCEFCGKKYDRPFLYKVHLSSAHGFEKPFACQTCGKRFSMRGALLSHESSHSEDRLYKCTTCSKAFKLKGTLRTHMMSHVKVKRFWCDLCDSGFKWNGSLTLHKKLTHKILKS